MPLFTFQLQFIFQYNEETQLLKLKAVLNKCNLLLDVKQTRSYETKYKSLFIFQVGLWHFMFYLEMIHSHPSTIWFQFIQTTFGVPKS